MSQVLEKVLVEKTETVRSYLESRKLRANMFAVLRNGQTLTLDEEIHEGENIILIPHIAGG